MNTVRESIQYNPICSGNLETQRWTVRSGTCVMDQSTTCTSHFVDKRPPDPLSFYAEHHVNIPPLKIPHSPRFDLEHLRRRLRMGSTAG
jgi:hypothetical protein